MREYLLIILFVNITMVKADTSWNSSVEQNRKQLLFDGQQYVANSRPDFRCGGFVVFDSGAAMDMPIYYAKDNPRIFLCSTGMGGKTSVDPNDSCPPIAWIESGCESKYIGMLKKYRENLIENGK